MNAHCFPFPKDTSFQDNEYDEHILFACMWDFLEVEKS